MHWQDRKALIVLLSRSLDKNASSAITLLCTQLLLHYFFIFLFFRLLHLFSVHLHPTLPHVAGAQECVVVADVFPVSNDGLTMDVTGCEATL